MTTITLPDGTTCDPWIEECPVGDDSDSYSHLKPKSRNVSGNNLWSCSFVRLINSDNLLLDLSQDCSRIPCQELLVQVDLADNVDRPLDSLRVPWPFLASFFCRQPWLQFCLRHVAAVRNISDRHLTLGHCVDPLRDQLFYLYSRSCLRQVHHLD